MGKGTHLLKEKDFVAVVDEEGKDLGYEVPKHWDADQLAVGVKKKGKGGGSSSSASGASKKDAKPVDPDAEPAGNASGEIWAAYAKSKGATDEDLLDTDGNPLGRDAIRDKYAAPAQ